MEYISKENRDQINLLPECIEDYVEENNPVRVIDAYVSGLDLSELDFTGANLFQNPSHQQGRNNSAIHERPF